MINNRVQFQNDMTTDKLVETKIRRLLNAKYNINPNMAELTAGNRQISKTTNRCILRPIMTKSRSYTNILMDSFKYYWTSF